MNYVAVSNASGYEHANGDNGAVSNVVVSETNDHGTSERRPPGAVNYVAVSNASGYEHANGGRGDL